MVMLQLAPAFRVVAPPLPQPVMDPARPPPTTFAVMELMDMFCRVFGLVTVKVMDLFLGPVPVHVPADGAVTVRFLEQSGEFVVVTELAVVKYPVGLICNVVARPPVVWVNCA